MSSDTTTRRGFLMKSASVGAAVAGADLLASTVEAAAPAAQGETAQQLVYWDWWSPVGNARMARRYAWIKIFGVGSWRPFSLHYEGGRWLSTDRTGVVSHRLD